MAPSDSVLTTKALTSGNWGHSSQPLYIIILFPMYIHLHHSDTHLDQVSYSMGMFRVIVIFNQSVLCIVNSARLLVCIIPNHNYLLAVYMTKTQFMINVTKSIYSNAYALNFLPGHFDQISQ